MLLVSQQNTSTCQVYVRSHFYNLLIVSGNPQKVAEETAVQVYCG